MMVKREIKTVILVLIALILIAYLFISFQNGSQLTGNSITDFIRQLFGSGGSPSTTASPTSTTSTQSIGIQAFNVTGAARTMPSNYFSGVPITVNISLDFNSGNCGGVVVENVPSGWNVTGVSGLGAGYYNSTFNTVIWTDIFTPLCGGSSLNYNLGYIATPNSSQSGTKVFNGVFSVSGIDYSITGNTMINQSVTLTYVFNSTLGNVSLNQYGNPFSCTGGAGALLTCTSVYNYNQAVSLTVTPFVNTNFTGWTGACSGTNTVCSLTMNADKTVNAGFSFVTPVPTGLAVTGVTQTSASLSWNSVNSATYRLYRSATPAGTYSLVASPSSTSYTDSGLSPSTSYYYKISAVVSGQESSQSSYVNATTSALTYTLTIAKAGTGGGTVTSSDGNISCGAICSAGNYLAGTSVTLTGIGNASSYLSGWSACSGNATCTLTINGNTTVTATFNKINTAPIVNAGNPQTITLPAVAILSGTASDDGLPNPPGMLAITWSKISGPGSVTFGNANNLTTNASFSTNGAYTLMLNASDGALSATSNVVITVNPVPIYHPADVNNNLAIDANEYTNYTLYFKKQFPWPTPPSPPNSNYSSIALDIFKLWGQSYAYNASATSCPACWIRAS